MTGRPVAVVWSVSLSEQESEQLEQILSESGLKPGLEGFEELIRQILSGDFGEDEDDDNEPTNRRPRARTDALEQLLRDHGTLIAEGGKIALEALQRRFLRPRG
jgi:hypothetical protein